MGHTATDPFRFFGELRYVASVEGGENGDPNHSGVVLKKTLTAAIIALFFFVFSETIPAVQRPPYPIRAEDPGAGHWVIINTNGKTR